MFARHATLRALRSLCPAAKREPMPQMRPIALVNARLVDPKANRETVGGVYVVDGVIVGVGAQVTGANLPAEARIIDCAGDVVAPGLVDMRAF